MLLIFKKFSCDHLLASLCIIFQPIISKGNRKFVAYAPCLKCHAHNKLTGWRVYVGIGSLVCTINLLISPVANILIKLGCHSKGTEDFSRQ